MGLPGVRWLFRWAVICADLDKNCESRGFVMLSID